MVEKWLAIFPPVPSSAIGVGASWNDEPGAPVPLSALRRTRTSSYRGLRKEGDLELHVISTGGRFTLPDALNPKDTSSLETLECGGESLFDRKLERMIRFRETFKLRTTDP